MFQIDLSNKIALVTGASKGIGKAIAIALGKAGATVIIHYNSDEAGAKSVQQIINNDSITIQTDLKDTDAILQLVENSINTFGKIDILVNNAGIAISSEIGKNPMDWLLDWQII